VNKRDVIYYLYYLAVGWIITVVITVGATKRPEACRRRGVEALGATLEVAVQQTTIDSLQALLHVQEVDMEGLRTLCYIKTPAKGEGG
jgi:hypothetical protein